MKQAVCIIALLLGILTALRGQEEQNFIRGTILNNEHQPIEFANIALLSPDSTFLQGTCSRSDGAFEIRPVIPGNYLLQVSYIGYQSLSRPCTLGETGEWILSSETIVLEETTITAHRPAFKLKAGKLEANVQNTLLSTLNNANDVLKHVPGIHSSDEGFTVFGKGTPIIYIDNRLLQDASELERLSASDIEKVELINNPGAEYDATVKAVIRIRTIRNKRDGIGANIRAGITQGRRFSHYQQVNMNYQKQGLSMQGMLYHNYNSNKRYQDVQYEIPSTVQWVINSNTCLQDKGNVAGARTSLSYDFNPRHSIGAAYEFYRTPDFHLNSASDYTVQANSVLTDRTDYTAEDFQQDNSHKLNTYYQGKVQQLQIDFTADLVSGKSRDHQESEEHSQAEGQREISSFNRSRKHLYAAKLILTHPLWKGDLKAGADYTFIRRKDYFNNLQNILPNTDSRIDENKAAGFGEYSVSFNKVNATAGIRFEHAASDYWEKGEYIPEQSRTYNDWCPNFSIDFPIGKGQASLSYTAKNNRPSFFQLRSSMSYNNRFIYEAGNPLLTPETYHDLQLSTLYRWLQFSISYQYRRNAISFVTREYEENPDVVIFTLGNFKKQQYLRSSVHLSPTFKIWKPEVGIYFTQPFFELINQGVKKSMNQASVYIRWNNSIQLPANTVFSIDMDYLSSGNFGALLQRPYWAMDAGIRKTFFNKKLTIGLQASDLWDTRRSSFMLFGPKLTYSKRARPDSRRLSLTVSYRINSNSKAYKGKHVSDKDMERL